MRCSWKRTKSKMIIVRLEPNTRLVVGWKNYHADYPFISLVAPPINPMTIKYCAAQ